MRAPKRATGIQRHTPRAGTTQQQIGLPDAALQPGGGPAALLDAPDLLALQRSIGNRATGRLLHQAGSNAAQPAGVQGFSGQIQRVMSMDSLRKAFQALGADAAVNSMPSFDYGEDLNERIAVAQTAKERQQMITEVQQAYGIDTGGDGMTYDPAIVEDEAVTSSGRPAQIGPKLFTLSTGPLAHLRMALTLNHENLHRQQYKRIGETDIGYAPNVNHEQAEQIRTASHKEQMLREVMAYESELVVLQQFRDTFYQDEDPPALIEQELTTFEQQAIQERDDHLQKLSGEEQKLFQEGKYAELLARIRQQVPDEAVRFAASEDFWNDFIEATAILYKLKDMATKWRPSRSMQQTWRMLESALERRFYENKVGHWWLVGTKDSVSALNIKDEVNRMLKEQSLVLPFNFWNRVRASGWIPKQVAVP